MPRTSDSRERMVSAAARLFRAQGYAATGWRQVIAESGAPWGSQAHFFPAGKEELAVAALGVAAAQVERGMRAVTRGVHPADAVQRWAAAAATALAATGWSDGCPVATVALEMAHTSDALADASAAAFRSWRDVLGDAITAHGVPAPEAAALGTLVLAGLEGAMVLARAARDPEPLHTVGRELAEVLRGRIADPHRPDRAGDPTAGPRGTPR